MNKMKTIIIRILTAMTLSVVSTACSISNVPAQSQIATSSALSDSIDSASLSEESGSAPSASAIILSVEGGELDSEKKTISMLVDPNTASVSLSSKVRVSEGSKWKLYRGETEIATKVASTLYGELLNGNNAFFIVVSANEGLIENTYELSILMWTLCQGHIEKTAY